jgi:putative transposase
MLKKYMQLPENQSISRIKKREQNVWQRRFWEHQIRDENDFYKHLDYIHYNPVKHQYVNAPKDWEWSTFNKYVDKGWYPLDWGMNDYNGIMETCTGE